MKKRPCLAIEQLEARETPDVSLGRAAALAAPPQQTPLNEPGQLGPDSTPGEVQHAPVLLTAPGITPIGGPATTVFNQQAHESIFVDAQELDRLLAQSLKPTAPAIAGAGAEAQQIDVGEFHAIEAATSGWKFFSNYVRKAIRNEEMKYGRLPNHDDLANQIYVDWREQVGGNGISLAHLLDKDSAERQLLRKSVRRTLDHERYDQQRQQKVLELIDQPAPARPAEQEWIDLQIDWSQGVGDLEPREQRVLELRRQGMTFEEIGAATGMVKQRVFEIYNSALDRLQEVYSS